MHAFHKKLWVGSKIFWTWKDLYLKVRHVALSLVHVYVMYVCPGALKPLSI